MFSRATRNNELKLIKKNQLSKIMKIHCNVIKPILFVDKNYVFLFIS